MRGCILLDIVMRTDAKTLESIDAYFASAQALRYAKGQSILRSEDVPYGVYYLKVGYVRQYLLSPSGDTFIIHIYKPGSFFPLPWVLNDLPNLYHFEAMTDVTIARGKKEPFVQFLQKNPPALYYAAQKLAAGMYGLVNRVGQLVLDNAYTKTVLLLLYFAETFGENVAEGTRLTVPLTHREIASWIGTTRETASLQIEGLIKRGLIQMHGRQIIITDLNALATQQSSS